MSFNHNWNKNDSNFLLLSIQHARENARSFDLRVKILILPHACSKWTFGEHIAFWSKFLTYFDLKLLFSKSKHKIQVYSLKPNKFWMEILLLLALKWHILRDDHFQYLLFEGGTPLNNPPIEIHANSLMFALVFWPHVTIFWTFWLRRMS